MLLTFYESNMKRFGSCKTPKLPTAGGGSSLSGGKILNRCTIEVKNKKSSIFAKACPRQTLFPIQRNKISEIREMIEI